MSATRAFRTLLFALLLAPFANLSAQELAGLLQPATDLRPAFRSNPEFLAEVTAARAPGTAVTDQIAHWQRAFALSENTCPECAERIATISFRTGAWETAIRGARDLEALSAQPADQAYAELLHGSAVVHLNDDQPTPKELAEADTALRAAFAHDPQLRTALYLDGRALAALHKDDAARDAFTRYIALAPADDRYRARAQTYLANLSLARAAMAPPFALTTLDGRRVTLDDLHGQVVLLDFWATWCVPCRQFLPRLQKLAADLKGQPFTLLSVSADDDADAWEHFIAANGMTWPQVLDTGHTLAQSYGVDGLPHYFTIDPNGALQSEVVGLNPGGGGGSGPDDLEARIRALLAKADRDAHPRRKLDKLSSAPASRTSAVR